MIHLLPWCIFHLIVLPPLICGVGRADQPLCVRVLCYNIHHGEGQDFVVDLHRIARVINSVAPDVVALQEVDSKVRRSGLVDEPAELAGLTKMQYVFGHNIPHEGGLYGNAVLSKWPIHHAHNHPLPTCYLGEQRGVLEVAVEPPGDQPPLLLLATHFDYRPHNAERLLSARMINDLVRARGGMPALLMGDLNDIPTSSPISELDKLWRRANCWDSLTYPVDAPLKQIDYVMTYPHARWQAIETRVLDETMASDHRPLLVVLELRWAHRK